MNIHTDFDGVPKTNEYHKDPSLPHFSYPPKERAAKRAAGLTEQQITDEENAITNRQVEAKVIEEQRNKNRGKKVF